MSAGTLPASRNISTTVARSGHVAGPPLLESGCGFGDPLRHGRIEPAHHVCPWWLRPSLATATKKADVVKYPEVFDHVGLLFNGPVAERRLALHSVIRQAQYVSPSVSVGTPMTHIVYSTEGGKQADYDLSPDAGWNFGGLPRKSRRVGNLAAALGRRKGAPVDPVGWNQDPSA